MMAMSPLCGLLELYRYGGREHSYYSSLLCLSTWRDRMILYRE